jgi:hypothetical protein
MSRSLIEGDIVYDEIISVTGAIGKTYQNYYDMLMSIAYTEEELNEMNIKFTNFEKERDEFYLLYVNNGEELSCDSRLKFQHRPNINKMLK